MPRLNQRRVDALEPRQSVRHVRDSELKGFGVRILPSGRKTYVLHTQHQGERVWKTLGHAHAMTESEARARAVAVLASIHNGHACVLPEDTVFEAVAETVFRRYRRRWKPSTFRVNLIYYRNQILPWFRGRQIADIDRQDVRSWQASLHANPDQFDRMAFQDVIRTANEQGLLLGDWPDWRSFREMRGRTSHTYNEDVALEVIAEIPRFVEEATHLRDTLRERLA